MTIQKLLQKTFNIFSLIGFLIPLTLNAQVGINKQSPDPSTVLDLSGGDNWGKGLLVPSMPSGNKPQNPTDGLLYYNTTTKKFEFYDGSTLNWKPINLVDVAINNPNNYFIAPPGNLGIGSSNPLQKLHVEGSAYISGNIGLGTSNPLQKLHVTGNTYITGNLGIGNSSPLQKLHVAGNTYITGNLGLGTSSPTAKLDVKGTTWINEYNSNFRFWDQGYSNNASLDMWSGYSGGAASSLSTIRFFDNSGNTKYASIEAWTDPSGAPSYFVLSSDKTTILGGKADVKIFSGADGWNDPTVEIIEGKVGINKLQPTVALDVVGDICYTGAINSCSDKRYKKDLEPLTSVVEKLKQVNGVYYYWKTKEFPENKFAETKQIGVIAQELETVYPELVSTNSEGYKSVDYARFSAVLLEAIKELEQKNQQQANIIQILQDQYSKEMKSIKAEIEMLKQNNQLNGMK